jgi:LacI family transcriptional regulator, repressor for deo operon, udp, cdd, tsx, nupC, and nupG
MDYLPSQIARSLATGETRTLGVVITEVTDPFVAEVMKGAEEASREAGYTLLFVASRRDPHREIEGARLLLAQQVDALIVISSRSPDQYTDVLRSKGLPLVLINNELGNGQVHSVRTDNRDGVRQAITHLVELGHSRIAFVAGPPGGRSSQERLRGYQQALAEYALPEVESYVVDGSGLLEDGPRALAHLVSLPEPPSAVLCYNDLTAIGLLAVAPNLGVHVPDDLSVIGYDDIPLSAFTVPALTTVDQPKEALGRAAVRNCLGALAGEIVTDLVLPARLVARSSTTAPRQETRIKNAWQARLLTANVHHSPSTDKGE